MFKDKMLNPLKIIKPDNTPFYISRTIRTSFLGKFGDSIDFFHALFSLLTLLSFELIDELRSYFRPEQWAAYEPASQMNALQSNAAKAVYFTLTAIYYTGESFKWLFSTACAILCIPIIYLTEIISKKIKAAKMDEVKNLLKNVVYPKMKHEQHANPQLSAQKENKSTFRRLWSSLTSESRSRSESEEDDDVDCYFDYTLSFPDKTIKNSRITYEYLKTYLDVTIEENNSSAQKENSNKNPLSIKNLVLHFDDYEDNRVGIRHKIHFYKNPVVIPLTKENAAGVDALAQVSYPVSDALMEHKYYDENGRHPFSCAK